MKHYEMIAELNNPNSEQEQERIQPNKKNFFHEFISRIQREKFLHNLSIWGYTLGVSLLPFLLVFAFIKGPQKNFDILELFYDDSLLYLCVTMSAFSIYTYGRQTGFVSVHTILVIAGMGIYCFSIFVDTIPSYTLPLYDILDRRIFIACFLMFSVFIGFLTLLFSSMKKGEKK